MTILWIATNPVSSLATTNWRFYNISSCGHTQPSYAWMKENQSVIRTCWQMTSFGGSTGSTGCTTPRPSASCLRRAQNDANSCFCSWLSVTWQYLGSLSCGGSWRSRRRMRFLSPAEPTSGTALGDSALMYWCTCQHYYYRLEDIIDMARLIYFHAWCIIKHYTGRSHVSRGGPVGQGQTGEV